MNLVDVLLTFAAKTCEMMTAIISMRINLWFKMLKEMTSHHLNIVTQAHSDLFSQQGSKGKQRQV